MKNYLKKYSIPFLYIYIFILGMLCNVDFNLSNFLDNNFFMKLKYRILFVIFITGFLIFLCEIIFMSIINYIISFFLRKKINFKDIFTLRLYRITLRSYYALFIGVLIYITNFFREKDIFFENFSIELLSSFFYILIIIFEIIIILFFIKKFSEITEYGMIKTIILHFLSTIYASLVILCIYFLIENYLKNTLIFEIFYN